MKGEKSDLMTAGSMAKKLGVSDAIVKETIKELGIKPAVKKGVCNYYSGDAVTKVKMALK